MDFSEKTKQKVKERAHFRCCLCRKALATQVHHIIPKEEGGPNTEDNAAPLCATCHDLYGQNPDMRKFIRQSRDFWYDFCDRQSPLRAEEVQEMLDRFSRPLATKEDLQNAVLHLESRMQNIMSQPLLISTQAQQISDVTAAFSDLVAIGSDSVTISEDVGAQLWNTCPECGARYPASENACPKCGTPWHEGE